MPPIAYITNKAGCTTVQPAKQRCVCVKMNKNYSSKFYRYSSKTVLFDYPSALSDFSAI